MSLQPQLTIPINSIRFTQCQRLFNLIQQNIESPKTTLSTQNLESFLKQFFYPQETVVNAQKVMQQLSKQNTQMTGQKFAQYLSNYTKDVQLTNDESLGYYYKQLRNALMLKYQKPLQQFQKWDSQQLWTAESMEKKKLNIDQFFSRLQPYIDGMEIFTFQNSLEQINYCLSIVTMPVQESVVLGIYKVLVNSTVLLHLSQFLTGLGQFVQKSTFPPQLLTQSQNLLKYFTTMSYLYTACSYPVIKQKLFSNSCLFYNQTFTIITFSLNIPEPRIKRQAAICLALLSKHVDQFGEWVLASIDGNFMPLLKSIGGLTDQQGLYYTLICLKNIICRYRLKPLAFRQQPGNQKTMEMIQQFSYLVLKSSELIETQKQCLLLINQLLKVCTINYVQLEELKMTCRVFVIQQPLIQTSLVPATLKILQTALTYQLPQLTNVITSDLGFLYCLQNNLQNKQCMFYYQLLHIVYLISLTEHKLLTDKPILLAKIVKMIYEDTNPAVVSIASEILFNIVHQSLDNDTILELLYDNYALFDKLIPLLFKKCFSKNLYIDSFMSINSNFTPLYTHFDKSMLMKVFECLYVLAVGVSRRHKKYAFCKKLNEEIIKSMGNILMDLFISENRGLVEIILRQKLAKESKKKIKVQSGVQLYKIVNTLLEQMTYGMQNRPVQFLRLIDYQKKTYSSNLLKSQFFSLHDLQVDNIPIYLSLKFNFQETLLTRSVPHKFQLSSIKSYVKLFIAKILQVKDTEIKDLLLKHVETSRVIENQVQYRTMVNKLIQTKTSQIHLEVIDVKLKQRRDQLSLSYIGVPNESLMRTMREKQNSFVGRQQSTRIVNNSNARFTPLREQPSQHQDLRRSFYSPINFNYSYRDKSPVFGGSTANRNK